MFQGHKKGAAQPEASKARHLKKPIQSSASIQLSKLSNENEQEIIFSWND